jgi:hypothetical protein
MITNDGKEIISKYLLGQVSSFATHLSVGCGAKPLTSIETIPNTIYGKQMMDFEMIRVPISSKGFVDDSTTYIITNKALTLNVATLTTSVTHDIVVGETVIVSGVNSTFNGQYRVTAVGTTTFSYALTATNVTSAAVSPNGSVIVSRTKVSLIGELPTGNKYEITEVGIWSAGNNNLANQYDSRMIFNFTQSWQYHGDNATPSSSSISIGNPPVKGNTIGDGSSNINTVVNPEVTMFVPTNDSVFALDARKNRKEGPRNLNTTLLVRGDMSTISPASGTSWTTSNLLSDWVATGTHIDLNNVSFDISGNNSSDLLKLAFSVIDKAASGTSINDVKILMEFYKNESNTTSGYAKAQIYVPGAAYNGIQYLNDNKYYVASWQLSQAIDYSNYSGSIASTLSMPYIRFFSSTDFSSSEIRVCRIWVMINNGNAASPTASTDNYISFDGFRIDNTLENPTYKMSGYSLIKGTGISISKLANTNNYIDFRFSLGVS